MILPFSRLSGGMLRGLWGYKKLAAYTILKRRSFPLRFVLCALHFHAKTP